MAIVKKADGTILSKDGIIRDAADPCKCCPPCPPCYDPKNEVGLPGSPCDCIPRRWLVVVSGASISCACTIGDFPPSAPDTHFEITPPTSFAGSYCMNGTDNTRNLSFPFALWGNDSPTDDCNNATLIDFGLRADLVVTVSFGVNAVQVDVTITGFYNSGGSVLIYSGTALHQPCEGPTWTVNLTSSGIGCGFDGVKYSLGAPAGATATLYPCGC